MLSERVPSTVVLDEFPYLLDHSPELPSLVQRLYDDARARRTPSRRLILCGSAMSVMARLLRGSEALRGRATLELLLGPFDYREARSFWEVDDLDLAFQLHAVVGGTPGYRDLLNGHAPSSRAGFLRWLAEGILNPSHALLREADHLLTEQPGFTDRGLYHSVLAAISRGATRPGQIASAVGRNEGSLRYPLQMLEKAQLISRDEDALRQRRPVLRVSDPVVRFTHVIVRPNLARLEERRALEAWDDAAQAFSTHLGPHLEELARTWTLRYASERALGGRPVLVGTTQVNDPDKRARYQVDVLALADRGKQPRVLAIGEAKAPTQKLSMEELVRLDRMRELIAETGRADSPTHGSSSLVLFGRGGFAAPLERQAAARDGVVLVDLERLYRGS